MVFQGVWILPHVAVELWQRHVEEFSDAMIDTMGMEGIKGILGCLGKGNVQGWGSRRVRGNERNLHLGS